MKDTTNFFNQENLMSCQRRNELVMLVNFFIFSIYTHQTASLIPFSLSFYSPPLSHFPVTWSPSGVAPPPASWRRISTTSSGSPPCSIPETTTSSPSPTQLSKTRLVSACSHLTLTHQHLEKLIFFFFAHVVVVTFVLLPIL